MSRATVAQAAERIVTDSDNELELITARSPTFSRQHRLSRITTTTDAMTTVVVGHQP